MQNIFYDIGLVIIIATFLAYLAGLIRQPLVIAYLTAGILIGPAGLKLISNADVITTLAEIGIAFFLFIAGLELSISKLKSLGKPIILAGIGQIVFTFIIGYFICLIFFSSLVSLIIAFAITSSSTMIVVKLLSDKNEIETLHGRIAIGILLLQDLVAILALSLLQSKGFTTLLMMSSLVKGILLLLVTFFASLFIIPLIFRFAARSQELLFASTIAWLFIVSILAHMLGFSIAIGAFIAGVTLAQLEYRFEIISRVKPVRDFFSIIFFVSLGMIISPSFPHSLATPIAVLSLFVIFGNPFVVIFLMGLLGFGKKTAFRTGISIGQASEFSLIFATQAFIAGLIDKSSLSVVTAVTAITLVATTYLIKYDLKIYQILKKPLSFFEFRKMKVCDIAYMEEDHFDAVLFGCDRMGSIILKKLRSLGYKVVIVDFNPDIIKELSRQKISCVYGDFEDPDVLSQINLLVPKIFISTIPDNKANARLVRRVKDANKKAIVFVTATKVNDALWLYERGADYVVMPYALGGEYASNIIEHMPQKLKQMRKKHIEELKNRKLLKQDN